MLIQLVLCLCTTEAGHHDGTAPFGRASHVIGPIRKTCLMLAHVMHYDDALLLTDALNQDPCKWV